MNLISNVKRKLDMVCEKNKTDLKIVWDIIILFTISRLLMLVIALICNQITGVNLGFVDRMNQFDAGWYRGIIENGYTLIPTQGNQANWAFSPLYPMTVSLVNYILPFGIDWNGIIVSNICVCIGTYFGVKYYTIRTGNDNTTFFVFMCMCSPYTFYFSSMYAEGMVFMLTCIALYHISKHQYVYAGLFIGFTVLARSYNIYILIIMLISIYTDNFDRLSIRNIGCFIKKCFTNSNYFLGILLCPLGLFLYLLYMYIHIGDIWAFWGMTKKSWGSTTMIDGLMSQNLQYIYLTAIIILILFIGLYLIKHKMYPEGILAVVIAFMHRNGINNIGRHSISMVFPITAVSIFAQKNKKYEGILYASLTVFECVLIYLWYCGNAVMI